jgi:hypothetical protein
MLNQFYQHPTTYIDGVLELPSTGLFDLTVFLLNSPIANFLKCLQKIKATLIFYFILDTDVLTGFM